MNMEALSNANIADMSVDALHEAFAAERSNVELRSALLGEITARRERNNTWATKVADEQARRNREANIALVMSPTEMWMEHRGWSAS